MYDSKWIEANQRHLSTALALVRNLLEQHIARRRGIKESEAEGQQQELQRCLLEFAAAMPVPAALTRLCATFHLSPFERDLLLLCAGTEFDGAFAALCVATHGTQLDEHSGVATGPTTIPCPTFGLALAALLGAHWDALTPIAALRCSQLILERENNAIDPLNILSCSVL